MLYFMKTDKFQAFGESESMRLFEFAEVVDYEEKGNCGHRRWEPISKICDFVRGGYGENENPHQECQSAKTQNGVLSYSWRILL